MVLNPLYAEAHCNLGAIHKSKVQCCVSHQCPARYEAKRAYRLSIPQGELEEAIVCYQKALQAAPNFTMVSSNLAVALTDLGTRAKGEGKLQEAIKLYERALSYNPTVSRRQLPKPNGSTAACLR